MLSWFSYLSTILNVDKQHYTVMLPYVLKTMQRGVRPISHAGQAKCTLSSGQKLTHCRFHRRNNALALAPRNLNARCGQDKQGRPKGSC